MSVPAAHNPADGGLPRPDEPVLHLLGRFDITGARVSAVGSAAQRLLALLAVRSGTVARWQAAQLLYPQASSARATSSLRAVMWRLQRHCPVLLETSGADICLAPRVGVDYWKAAPTALRLLSHTASFDADELTAALHANLRDDLLPGWPETWLVPERERFHQLRLHAMEALCARLTDSGWFGAAVDVGLAVVSADPLRESAQRALINAYLAEGNACEAIRQFDAFRVLLHTELGLEPSEELRGRVTTASAMR